VARRFKLLHDGTVRVRMLESERDLLARLPGELEQVVTGGGTVVVERGTASDTEPGAASEASSDAASDAAFEAPPEVDRVFARLFPRAYLDPTEEAAETEFQRLIHEDLVRERLAAFSLVSTTLERSVLSRSGLVEVVLTAEETHAWLGILNDARLALGTALGVTEETDYDELDPDDPETAPFAIYGWLTMLQGALLDALMN
jgi:Domain of unknown function (DUF2017)